MMHILCGKRQMRRVLLSILLFVAITFIIFWNFLAYQLAMPNDECSSRTNILFLKTHKTASSVIQNILMRYANRHHLLLALPVIFNYFGHPEKFDRKMLVYLKEDFQYNIFAHHTRFNYEQMKATMPDNTIFITILRDPVALFESEYEYYNLEANFRMNISTFANSSRPEVINRRYANRLGRNQMAFDLGIEIESFDDESEILRAIQRLDGQFHLVLITEFMDESLILLKEELCWTMDDVIAFKLNARTSKRKHKNKLSLREMESLRKINRADQIIYDYFYEKFQQRIKAFGLDKMKAAVRQLRSATQQWYEKCVEHNRNETNNKIKLLRFKKEFANDKDCTDLTKTEVTFNREMLKKQMQFYNFDNEAFNYVNLLTEIVKPIEDIITYSLTN